MDDTNPCLDISLGIKVRRWHRRVSIDGEDVRVNRFYIDLYYTDAPGDYMFLPVWVRPV